jgi:hypothetical protein
MKAQPLDFDIFFCRTYIDKVLNKCKKHKHFHLIKSNSNKRLLNKRNVDALSSISLSVVEEVTYQPNQVEIANDSSSSSLCNNQSDANKSHRQSSFIKFNEQKQISLNKSRTQPKDKMLTASEPYRGSPHHQQQRIHQQYDNDQYMSSSVANIYKKNEIPKTKTSRFQKKSTSQQMGNRLSFDDSENSHQIRIK